jgi:signal transduction histidine kinase/ActR/RegA family two-component response regulator
MFRTYFAFLCVLSYLAFLFVWCPGSCCAQTQYFEICKKQFETANPGSKLQLDAALKMTDALYFLDLNEALKQSDIALQLAQKRQNRAVVESDQRNKQLISQIAKLKQHSRDAELEYKKTNSSLQDRLTTAQQRSAAQFRILSAIAIALAIIGLITALRIYQVNLSRTKQRLSEEQESGRHVREIQAGLELKLSRLQRMESLGLLAGGVAHDFNNLLVGVLGNAEILQMKSAGMDEFTNQRINQIIKSAEKAADLSHQMLAYAGKRQIERCTVDLNQIVVRLDSVLRSNLKPSMELEIACWSLPLACEVDETQIEQVLMNLVSNAVSVSPDCGKILIRTGQEQIDDVDESLHGTRTTGGQFNFIEVEDLGSGISEADVERIFEPFFSDKSAGRGLGLAVVYGMVSGHDGLIRLDTQIGRGAKFRILLPNAFNAEFRDTANLSCIPLVAHVSDQALPTILVVDDEATVLDLTRQLLQVNGWNVLVATNGLQALEQIEDHKDQIRAILLDVVMPEFGAAALLKQLKDRQIAIPVVLMSGFSHTKLHDEFNSEAQVVEILEKPFRVAQLVQAIEKATGDLPRVA